MWTTGFLLGPTATLQSEQLKAFCDPHFYDGILLETVSDHQWLGFAIDAKARDSNFQPSREALADSFASKCRILEASSIRLLFLEHR